MSFSNPWWLPIGVVACALLIWLWRVADARQHAALARFVSAHLRTELTRSISVARRRVQRGLLLTALALLFVALAGPLVGFRWEQINRRGNEIVFAIDTSRSMSTPDIKPNRLARAKLAIDDFANQLDGDAVGIVAFAGGAFLVCPITLDYGAFHESLSAIDTNTIPRGGTNISSAIHEAQAALRRRPGSDRILILVTDGEDLEGSALVAAQTAKQLDGLRIYTVGVGTAGGDLIPVPTEQGGGFVKDETGTFVKSSLDETALKAIAAATGGFYVPLGTQGEGLETIFKTVLGPLAKHDLASRQQRIYTQRYQWPLAASLVLLLMSLLIGTRRRPARRLTAPSTPPTGLPGTPRIAPSASPTAPRPSTPGSPGAPLAAARTAAAPNAPAPRGATASSASSAAAPLATPHGAKSSAASGATTAAGLLLLMIANVHPIGIATSHAETAGNTEAAGKTAAAPAPSDPRQAALAFNQGTAAYRAGQFPQAAQAFQQSISHAPSSDSKRLADQEDAYYNLGNTLYRTGQKSEQSAPQEAIQKWTDAVKAYETALQLQPNDADSKYNRDLVKRKIEALKQQQNQNKNQGNGSGQSQGQPPPGQPPGQGQPPPPGKGQPPEQGQPPPPGKGQPPEQGQSPPPGKGQPLEQGQPPQGQPPPGQGQPPGQQQQTPPQPPQNGAGQPPPAGGEPQRNDQQGGNPDSQAHDDARDADNQRLPGQMSREEARELLDSVKGDERHSLGAPLARQDADDPPERPIKNW